jgi:hypothetical protein
MFDTSMAMQSAHNNRNFLMMSFLFHAKLQLFLSLLKSIEVFAM